MPGLAENVLSLSRLRKTREEAMANLSQPLRLTLVAPTGPNPGALRMLAYVPPGLPAGAPLVVVLHGCTQNAASYDHGSGWSTLAERHGFALLFPEQQRANNPSLCFTWFSPDDVTRGRGEAESIRQMTLQMIASHKLDRRRVFVTGLSAGGAMTSAMLATAPDLFAGGAIIAGLPYGAASGMMEAFTAMGQVRRHTGAEWGALVRSAAPYDGPRPAVQIWHGTADDTVKPGNADELLLQWTDVLGLPARPDLEETVDGARHQVWRRNNAPMLERWLVPGLGHGTPILTEASQVDNDADRTVGIAGPYMLSAGIPSTWHLARAWGLLTQAARTSTAPGPAAPPPASPRLMPGPAILAKPLSAAGSVVEKALKAAGLMK